MQQTVSEQEGEKVMSDWKRVLDLLSAKIPETSYLPWVSPLYTKCDIKNLKDNDVLTLCSPQAFGVQMVKQKFLKEIKDAVFELFNLKCEIDVIFVDETVKKPKKSAKPSAEVIIAKEKMDQVKQMHSFCALNLKYTFENFVVGENSKFAYNVAKAVAKNPGQQYNPFFIYGPVGIGKTHLMQAIGHSILKNFPELRVKYTKAEEFTNQLINAIKTGDAVNKMRKFRDMYRNVDVLLIDDIQFLEGKQATEEEVFNTFDTLYNAQKQIVFVADRAPSEFLKTPERLRSRYASGMNIDIQVPDYETRIAIVEKYATRSNYEISREISSFLAQTYDKNVRELESAYNKISAWASISNETLDLDIAKKILGYDKLKKKISVLDIVNATSKFFDIDQNEIFGTSRTKDIAHARKCAMYVAKNVTKQSLPALAREFNKNHTTVLYSCETIEKELQTNKELKEQIAAIKRML